MRIIRQDLSTRLIDLTMGELLDAIDERIRQARTEEPPQQERRNCVYGLKGLADLLGCSKTTASRLKTSGRFDEAITQIGALLVIDADKVMEIARRKNSKTNQPLTL